jgi:hypothetical protein
VLIINILIKLASQGDEGSLLRLRNVESEVFRVLILTDLESLLVDAACTAYTTRYNSAQPNRTGSGQLQVASARYCISTSHCRLINAVKTYEGVEVKVHALLNSALD